MVIVYLPTFFTQILLIIPLFKIQFVQLKCPLSFPAILFSLYKLLNFICYTGNNHRCWSTAYELSQEIHDKQVEVLQRRFFFIF